MFRLTRVYCSIATEINQEICVYAPQVVINEKLNQRLQKKSPLSYTTLEKELEKRMERKNEEGRRGVVYSASCF